MGLAEKRAVKEFQDNKYGSYKTQIEQAVGFPVEIEVKWDTLMLEGSSHLYDKCFGKIYFEPVVEAFKKICVDDMGKEAVKGALKKILIQNTAGIHNGARIASFSSGLLTIDHLPTSNVDSVKDRVGGIVKTVESAL